MTTTLFAIAVTATPLAAIVGLLRLANWLERRRDACHARQIELTDAIHREMGAAAAPTVERLRGGGWLVRMSVPLDRPAVAAAILRVTEQMFASRGAGDRLQIVLTPRRPSAGATAGSRRSAPHRPVRSGASVAAAVR